MTAALVALAFVVAAAAGAIGRFALAQQSNRDLPLGTLGANLAASFAAGALSQLDGAASTVLSVALLGSLSTWSSLANEVRLLDAQGRRSAAAGVLVVSVVGGISLALVGLQVAHR